RAVRRRQVMALPEPEAVQPEPLWHELQPLLDQELGRLPAKYRVPIILCDLENKSTKEAARNLGWPQETLAGRLARGRTMLAKRLTRHGLMLSGGALAAALSQNAAGGSAPPSLMGSTLKAANLFTGGEQRGATRW